MLRFLSSLATLAVGCLLVAAPVRADQAPDPLRLVPEQADFFVKLEQPGKAIELAVKLATMPELQGFSAYREYYESTNYRRFQQLVAYFEKELGKPWPELVDQLAGGGGVLAVKFGGQPPPVMVVIQGKDPALTKKFSALALNVIEQELARQERKERPTKSLHRDVEVIQIGGLFHAAVIDSTIVYSNVPQGVQTAIDLHLGKGKAKSLVGHPQVLEARKLLPAGSLAWAWLNFENVKKSQQAKDLFELPNAQPVLHILFGGYLDVANRSPFLTAAVYQEKQDTILTVRMPKGRDGVNEAVAGLVPAAGETGSLPLLQPKGTLYSSSYYMDVNSFWEKRAKLFPEGQIKGIEDFDKNSGTFLLGTRFSQLLGYAGKHQRLVATRQRETGYKVEPQIRIPSFAWVVELRDADAFSKAIEPPLRSAGLLASFQAKTTLVEEKHGDAKIVGYRFAEDEKNKAVNGGILFNFSPAFVRVGDQFVFSSTLELAHDLVDEIERQTKAPAVKGDPAAERSRFSWQGLSDYLDVIREQLVTQTILSDGSTPDEARKQVELLLRLLDGFGTVEKSVHYDADRFRFDIRVIPEKK